MAAVWAAALPMCALVLNQPTDRTSVNPHLRILQNNCGATRAYALQAAIDGGIRTGGFLEQRGVGFARTIDLSLTKAPRGDGTDIGAFKLQTEPLAEQIFSNGFE
jgi:hypothetical protein